MSAAVCSVDDGCADSTLIPFSPASGGIVLPNAAGITTSFSSSSKEDSSASSVSLLSSLVPEPDESFELDGSVERPEIVLPSSAASASAALSLSLAWWRSNSSRCFAAAASAACCAAKISASFSASSASKAWRARNT